MDDPLLAHPPPGLTCSIPPGLTRSIHCKFTATTIISHQMPGRHRGLTHLPRIMATGLTHVPGIMARPHSRARNHGQASLTCTESWPGFTHMHGIMDRPHSRAREHGQASLTCPGSWTGLTHVHGIMARPRLRHWCSALNASTAAFLSSYPARVFSSCAAVQASRVHMLMQEACPGAAVCRRGRWHSHASISCLKTHKSRAGLITGNHVPIPAMYMPTPRCMHPSGLPTNSSRPLSEEPTGSRRSNAAALTSQILGIVYCSTL